MRASDLLTIDADGTVLDGEWDVTPAVHIHTELHRRRADAAVVVHNHPPYASALAAIGELPDLVHQNSSILADELVLVDRLRRRGRQAARSAPSWPSASATRRSRCS